MTVKIAEFMQPKSALSTRLTQGLLKISSLYPSVRNYVQQLKFKPKPRFCKGFSVEGRAVAALVPAGQLLPQPMVELPGGAHVAMNDMLGEALHRWR